MNLSFRISVEGHFQSIDRRGRGTLHDLTMNDFFLRVFVENLDLEVFNLIDTGLFSELYCYCLTLINDVSIAAGTCF